MIGFKEIIILGAIVVIAAVFLLPIWKSKSGVQGVRMDSQNEFQKVSRVVVTDIDIPFWDIVQLMIKWAIAAIPALIVLAIIGVFVVSILGGLIGVGNA